MGDIRHYPIRYYTRELDLHTKYTSIYSCIQTAGIPINHRFSLALACLMSSATVSYGSSAVLRIDLEYNEVNRQCKVKVWEI